VNAGLHRTGGPSSQRCRRGPADISAPTCARFVLMQYHQGQTTLPRLTALLHSVAD
jgi:hypothetical protein